MSFPQDDTFGPFSDSAAASGADPFTFSPTLADDLEDAAGFDAFGTEFGEFHGGDPPAGDGETTPTAETWSFTSGSSSDFTDTAEDFGFGAAAGRPGAQPAPQSGGETVRARTEEEAPRTSRSAQ